MLLCLTPSGDLSIFNISNRFTKTRRDFSICLLLDLVATAPLPGVAWSKLEIWEGSAAADVWLHPGDYLDFRKYALSGLSDLGFLDHLLDRFADTLDPATPGYGG